MRTDTAPWVIVAGGFHDRGGMDRANAALAGFLVERGTAVHLVGHDIDSRFSENPLATVHTVWRPKGMPGVAERLLARRGMQVAREVASRHPGTRVVVNGGNCSWPDINWVHAVHARWPVHDAGAPWWSRYRNRQLKESARRRERRALGRAALVLANSDATARAVVDSVGVPPSRVRRVYLGSDPAWGSADASERAAARALLNLPAGTPVVVFAGALGTDGNKGFDVLWGAWKLLRASGGWDAMLVVAGGGWRVRTWREDAERSGAGTTVRFLGFSPRIKEVLAAADLLVSPVRYEAYGLNVHEALCRGAAVMVTRTAGVVERFDAAMDDATLPEGVTPAELAARLRLWREDPGGWRLRAAPTAARLRARRWSDMAADIVQAAGERAPGGAR